MDVKICPQWHHKPKVEGNVEYPGILLIHTGKSLSEALILASINAKYEDRLFVEFSRRKLQVQYSLCTSNYYECQRNILMH